MTAIVLDTAGSGMGGAARWLTELDAFVLPAAVPVRVIGRGRRLTAGWLARREQLAVGRDIAVAANNVSFALTGRHRRVLLRNALHFLYPSEAGVLQRMPRSFHAQIRIVRTLARRADVIVVPCSSMAERVAYHVASSIERIAVRAHPVTPVGSRQPADRPFILVPVLPAPYKNLVPQLRALLLATARAARPWQLRVTAQPADLPADLVRHPRITPLGMVGQAGMAELWRSATAAFFPSALESFGYPLAEARVYGVPVLSPDTGQAREIAGPALLAYDANAKDSLVSAMERVEEPVAAQPHAFDREAYFQWLFQLPPESPKLPVPCTNDHKSGRGALFSQ
jgi:glycosyltransferase involved in cell wall biosynthesis